MTSSEAATLLEDFVNSLDIESARDTITTPAELTAWLAGRNLLPAGSPPASERDLATAIALREGLREVFLGHHERRPHNIPEELEAVLARLPLLVSLAGGPTLVPTGEGVAAGLGRIAAAIMESAADGTWPRLKACKEHTCRAAFLDTSKNRSRSWCSMELCGNRAKTRAYRARRRSADT